MMIFWSVAASVRMIIDVVLTVSTFDEKHCEFSFTLGVT